MTPNNNISSPNEEPSNQQLKAWNHRLKQQNEQLVSMCNSLKQEQQILIDKYNIEKYNHDQLHKKYTSIVEKNENIKSEISILENKIAQLQKESDFLKKERDELASARNGLLTELARYQRDTTSTYISGSENQNHLLLQDFKQLKDQEIQNISSEFFRFRVNYDSTLKANRKQEIAKIKSIISREILVKIRDLPLENRTNNIIHSLYTAFGFTDTHDIPITLKKEVEQLVIKGIELVNKIASADPPGQLWMEPEDTQFQPDRHEAILGCEEDGKILFTVYPGYLVGSRVFEKAIVFTITEQT